jgi:DNA-binding NtrC family response regulator/pSer/pThr/pTyr-binding forkhead associated (FHA) protein
MPRLIVSQNGQEYRVVTFTDAVTIGREPDNDIVLASPQVSRHHASIGRQENGDYLLFDHGSTNAVWVAGRKVHALRLVHGTTFRIVDHALTFVDDQADHRPTPVFADGDEAHAADDPATVLFTPEQEALAAEAAAPPPREIADTLSRLGRLCRELDALDEETALEAGLLDAAMGLLPAERGFLALVNDKNELVYAHTRSFDPRRQRSEVRQDLVQQVMASGRSVREGGAAGGGSLVCAPLAGGGRVRGCVYLDGRGRDRFTADDLDALALLARHGAALLENLGNRRRLHRERESLKGRLAARDETIIRSDRMVKLYEDIRTIAPIGVPVFISGEAGSGKELVASALHAFSGRKGAYIPLNCAAIPETLFESELFGSRRGAFHEAADKPGKLELATGGTLFLDEVADMALTLQPKLLRFLENGEVTRLGDTRAKKLDVRVVTATNRDVAALIAASQFRDDLFQRLSCFTLHVPPLRERRDDIEPLSRYFLGRFAREYNWPEPRLADSGLQALCRCPWPGNVRQLRNVLLRLAVQTQGRLIGEREVLAAVDGPGSPEPARVAAFPTLEEMERQHLRAALERAGGNISDAAALAGIARSTFYQKMKKYDISTG